MLDEIARRYTDNEVAQKVRLTRDRLFDKLVAAWLFSLGSYLD